MATNPFRYGALALDEAFTDRETEIAELLSDILNGQDVVVFAPRRYGKSSLVWRVSQEAIEQDVLVAHVNLMTAPTKERLAPVGGSPLERVILKAISFEYLERKGGTEYH